MSHFACIGVGSDVTELNALARRARSEGTETRTPGGSYIRWEMGDGAELWVIANAKGELMDMDPAFDSASRMPLRLTGSAPDPEEEGLGGLIFGESGPRDEGGFDGCPLAFDAPDFGLVPAPNGQVAQVALTGFAHALEFFAEGAGLKIGDHLMAPESFIPVGLFGPTPHPEARLMGHVLEFASRSNGITGTDFVWLRVRTLGGEIELVSPRARVSGEFQPGCPVGADVWLSGRVIPA